MLYKAIKMKIIKSRSIMWAAIIIIILVCQFLTQSNKNKYTNALK